jgi:uncharacterized protein DUF3558
MLSRSTRLAVSLLALLLSAACTTTSQGEPGPATDHPQTTGPTDSSPTDQPGEDDLPSDGAPEVSNPLDTTTFQQDPCRALTPAQTKELNVPTSGKPYDEVLGNGCEWRNDETRGKTDVVFLDRDPRGLSALYKANKAGKWAYFEELSPIDGYPAITRDVVDDRDIGNCTVIVGVSDEIAFATILQLSEANVGKKDPCEVGAQVAGMALQTMTQGG